MGMPLSSADWTVDTLQALPDDGQRYEIIDGELLVTPAPSNRHQRAVLRLLALLLPYVDSIGLDILVAPADVQFSLRTLVQPDVFVLPKIGGRFAAKFTDVGELILAVEILSPSSERSDRYKKRALYQHELVPEYWIIDVDARTIERWTPNSAEAELLTTSFLWKPAPLHEALIVDVEEYFRSVIGDAA